MTRRVARHTCAADVSLYYNTANSGRSCAAYREVLDPRGYRTDSDDAELLREYTNSLWPIALIPQDFWNRLSLSLP